MHVRFQGVEVGCTRDAALHLTEFTPPTTEVRSDRAPRLGADGSMVGRDLLGESVWSLTMRTRAENTYEVLALAERLEREWKAERARATPRPVALEYSTDHGLTWFRVYGRPGLFTGPTPDYLASTGHGQVDAQFHQTDPSHYASDAQSTRIGTVAGGSRSGWVAPFVFPLVSAATGEERAGRVSNGGDRPTPITVTFRGPCQNPVLRADGFEVGYRGSLAHDESVTVDGHMMTAVLRDGAGRSHHVPGRLTRRTRLSRLHVPPGDTDLWLSAIDQTATAYAQITWRDAYTSMQYGPPPPKPITADIIIDTDGTPALAINAGTHGIAYDEDGTPVVVPGETQHQIRLDGRGRPVILPY